MIIKENIEPGSTMSYRDKSNLLQKEKGVYTTGRLNNYWGKKVTVLPHKLRGKLVRTRNSSVQTS